METKRLYECLLLIDPAIAAGDWDGITGKITSRIERRGGEIVSLKKWDERPLAYEIDKKSRGTYILVYFKSEPESISSVERDFNLAEDVMRVMILRADFITSEEQMDKQAPTIVDLRQRGGFGSDDNWQRAVDFADNSDDVDSDDDDDEFDEDESDDQEAQDQTEQTDKDANK